MEAVFLYGFVAVIFGPPLLYFTFRALQRWKRGDSLFSTRDYARVTARGVFICAGAIGAHRWGSFTLATVLLIGIGWMWYVDWRSSQV